MNSLLKLTLSFALFILSFDGFGQATGDYQSRQTGNWSTVTTWQVYNSGSYHNLEDVGAGSYQNVIPDNISGVITLMDPYVVTIPNGESVTADQIEYENTFFGGSTGSLIVASGGTLIVNDGAGDDIRIMNDFVSFGSLEVFGTLDLSNAATIVDDDYWNNGMGPGPITPDTYKIRNGGVHIHRTGTGVDQVPYATWDVGSTCRVLLTSVAPIINSSTSFYDLELDGSSQSALMAFGGSIRTVNGDLSITSTNGNLLRLGLNTSYTLTIGGDFSVTGNSKILFGTSGNITANITGDLEFATSNNSGIPVILNATGTSVFNVGGDFKKSGPGSASLITATSGSSTINLSDSLIISAGTLTKSSNTGSSAEIVFEGGTQGFLNTGIILNDIDFSIQNGSTLNLGTSALVGSGDFLLNAGGTLGVGSADGLVTGLSSGNVRVSGTRTYTAAGNIVYNGSEAQDLGNEWGATGDLNGVAVNLEINNDIRVTNNIIGSTSLVGDLTLTKGGFNIGNSNSIDVQSNFNVTSGTIGGLTTSNLIFSGSGTMDALAMESGSEILNNLTVNRAGDLVLGSDLTLDGTLSLIGNLDFSGNSLILNGSSIDGSGGGGLKSSSTSNLTIDGTGFSGAIPFSGAGNQLNNLTFNSTFSAYTWNSAVTINNNVIMNQGVLTHTSGLTMASNSTFVKGAGSITTSSPNAVSSYNVIYNTAGSTSFELPSLSTALNDLTVSVSGTVTLQSGTTVNGDLLLNSGTLNASNNNLTVAGSNWTANGGSFTIDAANTVTLSNAGITTLGGSSIGGTQFGNLTINSGTTVSAPNANLNVSGTWANSGIFTPNSSTITFNGTSQNIDPNGQPFNNVDFAGTLTKTLQGALDVNGSLTINSILDVGANESINVAGTWANSGTFTAEGGTVTFDGTSQTITSAGQPFFNLTFASSGTKTLGGALDANGVITIDNGVTLDVGVSAYAINLAGGWVNNGTLNERTGTITFDGTTAIAGTSITDFGSVTIAGALTATSNITNVTGDWLYSSGSFNHNNGTMIFSGGTSQNITSGGQAFNNVTISGLNTKTLLDDIDINGNVTLSAATLSAGVDRAINAAGNWDASGGGIFTAASGKVIFDGTTQSIDGGGEIFNDIELASTTTATFSGDLSLTGNWNAITGSSYSASGTTSFTGTGAQSITSSGGAFGSVIIAGSGVKTIQDALDVNSGLTISSTLDVGTSQSVNVGGDWDATSGTFTPATGIVTLDGAAQSITSGSNSYNDLIVAGTVSKVLQDALDVNGDITISSTLDVGTSQSVNIVGDWINNGAFTGASGKVTFDGGGTSNVLGSATTAFNNVDVTGNTGVEIETNHNLIGTLALVGATASFDADGSGGAGVFTLISTADAPSAGGNIAALTTPANFTGDATVQRYMSSEGKMWRYLTTSVSGLTVADWQTQFPITGGFTGADVLGGVNGASLYYYDESDPGLVDFGWIAYPVAANSESINPGIGYSVYIRDSGGQTTVDQRGPINKGNFPFSVDFTAGSGAAEDGWNLLGNPYPAALDWDLLYNDASTASINPTIYIKDNGGGGGVYATFNASTSTGTNGGTKNIAQGQSFWVHANSASPALIATESMKTTASHAFFRIIPPTNYLRISLSDGVNSDETLIHFFDDALSGEDKYDAYKVKNSIFNLSSIMNDSSEMVINAIGAITCDSEVSIKVSEISVGTYTLDFSELESFDEPVTIYLTDNYTNTYNIISNAYSYPFSVTADLASFGDTRFMVSFDKPDINTNLLVSGSSICELALPVITIEGSEIGVNYFAVQNGIVISDTLSGNAAVLHLTVKDTLTFGSYEYAIVADNGCGTMTLTSFATIEVKEIFEITQVLGDQVCGANSLLLQATGSSVNGSYRWYNLAEDELPLAETSIGEFKTPSIAESHIYYVAAVNELGCEGAKQPIDAIVINQDIPTVSIDTLDNGVYQLVSSYSQGNQWYLNGDVVTGASSNTLIITEPGIYSVIVEQNGCTITSDNYDYLDLVLGTLDQMDVYSVSITPNPFTSKIEVSIPEGGFNLKKTQIIIYDIEGNIVYFNKKIKNKYISINLSRLKNGIYLFNIYDGEMGVQHKLLKE